MRISDAGMVKRESVSFMNYPGDYETEQQIDLELDDFFTNGRIKKGWVYWAAEDGLWRTQAEHLKR